jgi:FixJ family two-component response regulator
MAVEEMVSVVDDDVSVRESLPDLLRSFGFAVAPFASGEAFLASDSFDRTRWRMLGGGGLWVSELILTSRPRSRYRPKLTNDAAKWRVHPRHGLG